MNRIRRLLNDDEPVKWLFYGDSITHGAFHTLGRRDYAEHFSERVRTEMNRKMDVIINTAISGNNTRQLLQGFDWRVRQFKPTVVFLMIGMNDCSAQNDIDEDEFKDNLNKLVDLMEEIDSVPVMQTTCPILPGTAPERYPHFPGFMDVIRHVAENRKLPLVDHEKHWRNHTDKFYYWMSNPFHPNAEGHLAFAHFLFKELDVFDPNSNTCRLFVP